MSDKNNDFLEGLKVQVGETSKSDSKENFSEIDDYTCSSLMRNVAQIRRLLESEGKQVVDGKYFDTEVSSHHFYGINHMLSEAQYDHKKGKIDAETFRNKVNTICSEHGLDFGYLLDTIDKINLLEKNHNYTELTKLAQEIDGRVIEEREKRKGTEKE